MTDWIDGLKTGLPPGFFLVEEESPSMCYLYRGDATDCCLVGQSADLCKILDEAWKAYYAYYD